MKKISTLAALLPSLVLASNPTGYLDQACQTSLMENKGTYQELQKRFGRQSQMVEELTSSVEYEYERYEAPIQEIVERYKRTVANYNKSGADKIIKAKAYALAVEQMQDSMKQLQDQFDPRIQGRQQCDTLIVTDDGESETIERVPYRHKGKLTCARISQRTRREDGELIRYKRLHKRDRSQPSLEYSAVSLDITDLRYQAVLLNDHGKTLMADDVLMADDRYMSPGEPELMSQVAPFAPGYAVAVADGFAPTSVGNTRYVEETHRRGTFGNVWLRHNIKGSSTPYLGFCDKAGMDSEYMPHIDWGKPGWRDGYYERQCSYSGTLLKAPGFEIKRCADFTNLSVTEDQYDDSEMPTQTICVTKNLITGGTFISGNGYTDEVEEFRRSWQTEEEYLADHMDPYCMQPKTEVMVADRGRQSIVSDEDEIAPASSESSGPVLVQ